jgi:hypothetical protein
MALDDPAMEDVMSRIGFFAAGAAAMLVSALTAGSAAAQTSTAASAGTPLQLLQMLRTSGQPQVQTKTRHHTKWIARRTARTNVAAAKPESTPAQTAMEPPPTSVWPALESVPPVGFAAAETGAATLAASEGPAPDELVVGGQMVKVASPGDLNEIDVAANDDVTPLTAAGPHDAAASPPAANISNSEAGASKSDSLTASSVSPPSAAPVGSAKWIAQVLAALGGAVAAGSAAWFLIGATPQRTYG